MEDEKQKFVNITGAAGYLKALGFVSVSQWTVRAMIADGSVKSMQIGRKFCVAISDLDAFIEKKLRRK
jgi:excisionase family DNA binding protein